MSQKITKYIYTKALCFACDALKEKYKEQHIPFQERSGDRLNLDPRIFDEIDEIDEEAFLQLQMQNLTFPVELDIKGEVYG